MIWEFRGNKRTFVFIFTIFSENLDDDLCYDVKWEQKTNHRLLLNIVIYQELETLGRLLSANCKSCFLPNF